MPGPLLHVGALTNCFHGAPVTVPPTNTRVSVSGALALTTADVPAVAGCPFQIPVGVATKPQPCVTVKLIPSTKVLINNVPAAILTPATLCLSAEQIPQGAPVSAVQTRVTLL
jgi:hypothetical protein